MTVFSVDKLPARSVSIGHTGENAYTTLCFDVTPWIHEYPGARIELLYCRPDGLTYPVASCSEGQERLVWTPSRTDLACGGYGELELRMMLGQMLGKSERMSVKIRQALEVSERVPDQIGSDWIEGTVLRAQEAQKRADAAAASAADAATQARAASLTAEKAVDQMEQAVEQMEQAQDKALEILEKNEACVSGNLFANPIKGEAFGSLVSLDDVSSLPHTLDCRIYGKNLIPFPYVNKKGVAYTENVHSVDGVTFTWQEDGGVAVEGTATELVEFYLFAGEMVLPAGTYFVSGVPEGANCLVSVRQLVNGVDTYLMDTNDPRRPKTEPFTVNRITIYVAKGTQIPAGTVVYPMFTMGNAAGEYTRFVDPSKMKVTTCGKNFFDVSKITSKYSTGNYYFTNNKNGSLNVTLEASYSVSTDQTLRELAPELVVGQTYVLNATTTGTIKQIYLNGSNGAPKYNWPFGKPAVMTEDMLNAKVYFYASGANTKANIGGIQIELGQTATDYEPYVKGCEYTPEADGRVKGLTSICPHMSVMADTPGATLWLKYNRDINTVLERIEQAIISLGGNVNV